MNSSVTVKSELIWDGPAEFSALLLPPEDLRDLLIDEYPPHARDFSHELGGQFSASPMKLKVK